MKYNPISEEEINAQRGMLKEGPANFEVIKANDKISKAGNEMIELLLKVWDSDGKEGGIFDYLVSNAQWKIKHFYESIGDSALYTGGEIKSSNLIGSSGKAIIAIQKDLTGKHPDRPKIKDYLKSNGISNEEANKIFNNENEDDIPF